MLNSRYGVEGKLNNELQNVVLSSDEGITFLRNRIIEESHILKFSVKSGLRSKQMVKFFLFKAFKNEIGAKKFFIIYF